jgi:glutamate-1-semialdehyde 2,1-aminomutase
VDSLLVKSGSGALTHGHPDSAGVPAALAALTVTLPFNDLEAVEALFENEGTQIAGVILEPVPANAGLYFPRPGFLESLRELCSRYGSLLIFDEVMTGFRLGKGGFQERCGVWPDLTAFGKVIGGGLPVGAFGGRGEIMDQLSPDGPVYQAGTLSGNPLAMAAGLAQLRELERTDGYTRLEESGRQLEDAIRGLLKDLGWPLTFHRIGSMFCLYFTEEAVWNLEDAKKSDREAFRRFFHACLQDGVYFAPSQFEAGFLCLMHTNADLERTVAVVRSNLKRTRN